MNEGVKQENKNFENQVKKSYKVWEVKKLRHSSLKLNNFLDSHHNFHFKKRKTFQIFLFYSFFKFFQSFNPAIHFNFMHLHSDLIQTLNWKFLFFTLIFFYVTPLNGDDDDDIRVVVVVFWCCKVFFLLFFNVYFFGYFNKK